ncbi:hypothetical protein J0H58_21585 [bacterium]|nr:hypothetical protein [bacterium]
MRPAAVLLVVSALSLLGSGEVAAQKQKDKEPDKAKAKVLPPQNQLALDFADNPEKYKGKTVTFLAEITAGDGALRERIGDKGIPLDVYPPRGKRGKLLLGLDIPIGFPKQEVPNARSGDEVVVTFLCTKGSATEGNTLVAARRPD